MFGRRRVLPAAVLAIALGVTVQPVAEASRPALKKFPLGSYSVSVVGPTEGSSGCNYTTFNCGYIAVSATFTGLGRLHPRPVSSGFADGRLDGTVVVDRTWGCANAKGKRLRGFDRTTTSTVGLGNRRGMGFTIPDSGDQFSSDTFGFLSTSHPGNCPAGTTPMTYKIVAKQTRLELSFAADELPDGSYRAPGRGQWNGAVVTPPLS